LFCVYYYVLIIFYYLCLLSCRCHTEPDRFI